MKDFSDINGVSHHFLGSLKTLLTKATTKAEIVVLHIL